MEEPSTIKSTNSNPSVVTDWRTEIYGEPHQGSFVWEDIHSKSDDEDDNCCGFKPCCKGKKAILKGPQLKVPEGISIIEYFNERIAKFAINPLSLAIVFGEDEKESLSYHELDVLTNAIANLIIMKLGPDCINSNPDDDIIIALCIPPTVRYVALVFAVLKLGLGFLPIAMDIPEAKLSSMINEVRPILTIISNGVLTKVKDNSVKVFVVEELWKQLDDGKISLHLPVVFQNLPGDPKGKSYPPLFKRPVAIINASNSSGVFTGVRIHSRSIFNLIMWEWKYYKLLPDERILLQSDLDTVMSLMEIFSPLLSGNTLVILESKCIKHPIILLDKIYKHSLCRLHLWPMLLHSILTTVELLGEEIGREYLSSIKYWFCVGGGIKLETAETFYTLLPGRGRLLFNVYGNDEDMGAVSYQIIDSPEHVGRLNYHSRLPIGSPLPNTKIYVVDEKMQVVRDDTLGQICVAGKQLADSYTKSVASPKKLVPNPFSKSANFQILLKTGDYGKVIEGDYGHRYLVSETSRNLERHAHIEGRIVELDEIQALLKNTNMVKDCHVLCYRHGHEDQLIVAFCCVDDPKTLPKVIHELKKNIPPYMCPDVIGIQEMPKMEDGTVNENHLLRKYYFVVNARKYFDDWDSLGTKLSEEQLHATKVLFSIIYSMVGVSFKELSKMYFSRFLAIPRTNYSKAIFVAKQLIENRYPITLEEFMNAESLAEIVNLMVQAQGSRGLFLLDQDCISSESKFTIETLMKSHLDEVTELLATVLTARGHVDYYSEVKKSDLKKFLESMWIMFVTKKLSKCVRRKADGKVVGAIINVNWHDEMTPGSVYMTLEIAYRLQLMQILEDGFCVTGLPADAPCIQIVYAGLDHKQIAPLEVHSLMERMIASTIDIAKQNNYEAIVFTTYDFFVTDICVHNFGFKILRECKLNQFVAADGKRPYYFAPDTLVGSLCYRKTFNQS